MPRQGHNTPIPLRRSPPASFKRLLGRAMQDGPQRPVSGAAANPVGKVHSQRFKGMVSVPCTRAHPATSRGPTSASAKGAGPGGIEEPQAERDAVVTRSAKARLTSTSRIGSRVEPNACCLANRAEGITLP